MSSSCELLNLDRVLGASKLITGKSKLWVIPGICIQHLKWAHSCSSEPSACRACANSNLLLLFSCSVVSSSLQLFGLQHARPPCPSPSPGACSNSCPLSQGCHPTISSSIIPFSSCLQSFPASGSFLMSRLLAWGGQSIGVSASASVLPVNIQDWFPLGYTGWISLQSKGLSRVFSNTTV